tara:strand:- start:168 stop:407 length:240 start_codon:yes stop_codon:yes gene_type:complete
MELNKSTENVVHTMRKEVFRRASANGLSQESALIVYEDCLRELMDICMENLDSGPIEYPTEALITQAFRKYLKLAMHTC